MGACAQRAGKSCDETHAVAPDRFQVIRRADRFPDRAGTDRRRRTERLRQVQPRRSDALGDGRSLPQGDARRRHGRRHLLRQQRPRAAQHRRSGDDASTTAPAPRPPSSTATTRSKCRAGSNATRARPIASTAARCAPATSRSCSPTPRPARARRRWSTRDASARSSRRSPSSAAGCWKRPPASPDCMRADTRRSCACAPPSRTSPGSKTSSASSRARSTR